MVQKWANSSLASATGSGDIDLHVVVDRTGRRVASSLEAALREAVRDGRLAPGTTLPPTRTLAVDLDIARNTVAAVYSRLVDEGWLVARQGSRTRVADGPHLLADGAEAASGPVAPPVRHDLRAGFPDPTSFPIRWWTSATREALAEGTGLGYGPPAGSPELRAALARYLGRVRGVVTPADRLVVTAGFTSGLRTLAAVLRRRGVSAVGVEAYGHATHRNVLREAGLHTVALEVDDQGAVPDRLDRLGAVVLTSAHQFPLGVALSARRRAAFVRWARSSDALVIEDDYDGEFRYDRRAIGALQPHGPDHVVYAGTTSKTLAPGVGLGWFAASARLVGEIVEQQQAFGVSPSPLTQAVLARLIESGHFDRHVRRMRAQYRSRRIELTRQLADRGNWVVSGLDAGLHAVLDVPSSVDEQQLVELCRQHHVAVEGLRSYRADPDVADRAPALVVGYGTPPPGQYAAAVRQLQAALRAGAS